MAWDGTMPGCVLLCCAAPHYIAPHHTTLHETTARLAQNSTTQGWISQNFPQFKLAKKELQAHRTDRQMDGRTDGRTDRRMDGRTDGQTDGQTDGRTDGRTD